MRRLLLAPLSVGAILGCNGPRANPVPLNATTETTSAAARPRDPDPDPGAAVLRVLVAGDVMPHRPRLVEASAVAEALAPLAPIFGKAHAVVANFEAAIVREPKRYDGNRSALVASAAWMQALARSRIAAVTMSNNHVCDGGLEGLEHTIEVVDELGLVGIGADEHDPFRARVLAAAGGRRVCAVGWTAQVNVSRSRCAASSRVAIAPPTVEGSSLITRAIRNARESGCDAVVAIGHVGDEYEPQTWAGRTQALAAAEAGATAVVLHHPHVPSGIEDVTTKDGRHVPVFLSLGNLLSNQGESWHEGMRAAAASRRHVARNAWTRLGMIADLSFQWEKGRGSRPSVTWGYHLVWTEHDRSRRVGPSGGTKAKSIAEESSARGRIAVRPLDPAADIAIVRRLAADALAPKLLFDSPCWLAVGPGCR